MITNTGKEIIAKYLIGHTASYASYLAFGSGPQPLGTLDSFGNYATKTSLDFEMFRVPITSRATVVENGVTKIVLTAELPTTERYEITEIGVYPSQTNPVPTGLDSQTLYSFLVGENWKYVTAIETINVPEILEDTTNNNNDITVVDKAFFTNTESPIFDSLLNPDRITRHERPRFLDGTLLLSGDTSELTVDGSDMAISAGSEYISLGINPIVLDKNSAEDELRLAFSIVNKNGISSTDVPTNIKVLVRFSVTGTGDAPYASFIVNLDAGTGTGEWDFENNRYVVATKKIKDLYKTETFSWGDVAFIEVYFCANNAGTGNDNFFIALDAFRLENISSFTDVYGLTAYTVTKTSDSLPILKLNNTSNFIEFKYAIGVA